jgi:cytochrome c
VTVRHADTASSRRERAQRRVTAARFDPEHSARRCAATLVLLCVSAGSGAQAADVTVAGDHQRGRALIERYGCGSCHTIPKIAGARGRVGPPLESIAHRGYLGGRLPNTPANMVLWIRHPQRVDPKTAMPDLGVSEAEARDMAVFLYTLR